MDKIRVMFAMGGIMKRAGAETMVMQYLRQLVKDERFEFSILVHGYNRGDYDEEITSLGVPIYHVPIRGKHPITYASTVKKVFKAHPVDIVHCNMDSACGNFLSLARKCGIQNRIAHSHTTKYQAKNGIKRLIGVHSKKKIHNVATIRLACSKKAGQWLFEGDPFEIVNNAINLSLYYPKKEIYVGKREELGISDKTFVVGHVGRFCYEKNHKFLLQVFAKVNENYQNSRLLLVGTGELMDTIKAFAKKLGIESKILFLGMRTDIPELLQAMDCFVMPSIFEGLPVAGIEAQAAGLPCLYADTITPEICMTNYMEQLPLDDPNEWAKKVIKMHGKRNADKAQCALRKHGYDIEIESKKLIELYLDAYRIKNV